MTATPTVAPPPPGDAQSGNSGSSGDDNLVLYICIVAILLLVILIVVLVRKRQQKKDEGRPRTTSFLHGAETSLQQMPTEKTDTVESAATDTLNSTDGMFTPTPEAVRPTNEVLTTASHTRFSVGHDYAAPATAVGHDYALQAPVTSDAPEYAVAPPFAVTGAATGAATTEAYVAPKEPSKDTQPALYNVPPSAQGGTYSEPPREVFRPDKSAPPVVRKKPKSGPPIAQKKANGRAAPAAAAAAVYAVPDPPPRYVEPVSGNNQSGSVVYGRPDLKNMADPEYEANAPMAMIGGQMGPPEFCQSSYAAPLAEGAQPRPSITSTGSYPSLYTSQQYTAFLDAKPVESEPYDAFRQESNYAVARDATPLDAGKAPVPRGERAHPPYQAPPVLVATSKPGTRPPSYAEPQDAEGNKDRYAQARAAVGPASSAGVRPASYAQPQDATSGGAPAATAKPAGKRASYVSVSVLSLFD